jgi:hypothetical protein
MTDRVVPVEARPDLLRIYLNDHLTGAAGGVALARRLANSHRGTAAEKQLADLARETAEDRDALVDIMGQLGIARVFYKEALGTIAERVGRLKLNGTLLRRSPMSSVIELEGMSLGVHGKAAGWRALRELAASEPRLDEVRLSELIARADRQLQTLEQLRLRAVGEAFDAGSC